MSGEKGRVRDSTVVGIAKRRFTRLSDLLICVSPSGKSPKQPSLYTVHLTVVHKTNVIWKEGRKVMLAANACHQILVHSAHSCQKDHSFLPSFFLQRFPLPDSYLSAHSCFSSGEMGYLYLLEASDLCHFHLIRNFYRIFAIDLYMSDSQKCCLLIFGQFS